VDAEAEAEKEGDSTNESDVAKLEARAIELSAR